MKPCSKVEPGKIQFCIPFHICDGLPALMSILIYDSNNLWKHYCGSMTMQTNYSKGTSQILIFKRQLYGNGKTFHSYDISQLFTKCLLRASTQSRCQTIKDSKENQILYITQVGMCLAQWATGVFACSA